ncbi:MAG: hypothetical protein LBM98_10590 [Oscillospiraceae bacterium]|nr:hypothetical protein [Oscillospiraceae bacterium]
MTNVEFCCKQSAENSKVRHCEAPGGLRYVQCFRREAIQCRGLLQLTIDN